MNHWNYRFYKSVLFECSYDEQGRPDDYYSETSFEHLFSTEKYDQMVEHWTQEWESEKNGSIIEPHEMSILHDDGSRTTELYPPEPIIIPPKNVGSLEEYVKAKMAESWQELHEAFAEATWYDEQGFVPLAEEFEKPIEQRVCIVHLKTEDDAALSDEDEQENEHFQKTSTPEEWILRSKQCNDKYGRDNVNLSNYAVSRESMYEDQDEMSY